MSGRTASHSVASRSGSPGTSEPVLPVVDAVTDFEKIKRIGEGTYGVCCKCLCSLRCCRRE